MVVKSGGMSDHEIKEFNCAMCGNCCRGEGYVRIQAHEIDGIATHLDVTRDEFLSRFTRAPDNVKQAALGDVWLVDQPGPELACVFLKGNRCRIHGAKPVQCVGFPMKWRTDDIMDYCVGMQEG